MEMAHHALKDWRTESKLKYMSNSDQRLYALEEDG